MSQLIYKYNTIAPEIFFVTCTGIYIEMIYIIMVQSKCNHYYIIHVYTLVIFSHDLMHMCNPKFTQLTTHDLKKSFFCF